MLTQSRNWYAEIAVAILVLALIVLSIFLVGQYRLAARQGIISAERTHFSDLVHHRQLGAADTSLIAPWMTFGYVSISFKVPSSYLMTALGIPVTTAGYPNITLGHYAKSVATSSASFTIEVRGAVKGYIASTSSAVPPSSSPVIPQ